MTNYNTKIDISKTILFLGAGAKTKMSSNIKCPEIDTPTTTHHSDSRMRSVPEFAYKTDYSREAYPAHTGMALGMHVYLGYDTRAVYLSSCARLGGSLQLIIAL